MIKTLNKNIELANDMVIKSFTSCFDIEPHKNFLDKWEKEKSHYLTKLFGEELILEKDVEIELSLDQLRREIGNFRRDIMNTVIRESWYNDNKHWSLITELFKSENIYNNKIENPITFVLSTNFEGEVTSKITFSRGEKLTKGFKKLFLDAKKVNDWQIKYSQLMNTKKLKGKLCLSIHPMDFLTMSHTSTWGSCYDTFNHGEYRAGALEFMCSKNTICSYLYTKNMDIPGNQEWNDKKWRSIITVEPEKFIMTGKNYPYYSDELTEMSYEWVRELMKEENYASWEHTENLENFSYEVYVEYGYNDADCGSSDCFRVGLHEKEKNTKDISISYGTVPCPDCGNHNCFSSAEIRCEGCDDGFYCESCDDRCHGESYTAYSSWGNEISVCECCLDNHYTYCEECERYHYEENCRYVESLGHCICDDCYEEGFEECKNCSEDFKKSEMQDSMCKSCAEEEEEKRREQEEEERLQEEKVREED